MLHFYHEKARMFEKTRQIVDNSSNGCYKSNIANKSNTLAIVCGTHGDCVRGGTYLASQK